MPQSGDATRGAASSHGTVHVVSLGCARNDVDSEELAGRLAREGWTLTAAAEDAQVVVVNTCGFIEAAKKDSIDQILALSDLKENGRTRAVVAAGCLAERYGKLLADELPEADGVLGFDSYAAMSGHLRRILAGERPAAHVPRDRRELLPLAPAERAGAAAEVALPGHGEGTGPVVRTRLADAPWAPLKIASGCDRRCTFCAIPSFRGAFVSRPPGEVIAEARWLAGRGVRELLLVSETSTSYGKDLGDLRLLDALLPQLAAIGEIERVRVSYLQPAELRDDLIDVIAGTGGVAAYFDLSVQHVSPPVLRRMRRFGDPGTFLDLIARIRERAPQAGIRSSVITGFPGESEEDFAALVDFVAAAELDVCGVFGYSDEDGTPAARFDGKISPDVIAERVEVLASVSDEATARRAQARIGEHVSVLIEDAGAGPQPGEFTQSGQPWPQFAEAGVPGEGPSGPGAFPGEAGDGGEPGTWLAGRAGHQGPEVDGITWVRAPADAPLAPGDLVRARVVAAGGADLLAVLL